MSEGVSAKYVSVDQKVTYSGEKGRDDFRKPCFTRGGADNSTCSYNRQFIDTNSLISRANRIMAKLKPELIKSAYLVAFGAVAGTVMGVQARGGAVGAIAGATGGGTTGAVAAIAMQVTEAAGKAMVAGRTIKATIAAAVAAGMIGAGGIVVAVAAGEAVAKVVAAGLE